MFYDTQTVKIVWPSAIIQVLKYLLMLMKTCTVLTHYPEQLSNKEKQKFYIFVGFKVQKQNIYSICLFETFACVIQHAIGAEYCWSWYCAISSFQFTNENRLKQREEEKKLSQLFFFLYLTPPHIMNYFSECNASIDFRKQLLLNAPFKFYLTYLHIIINMVKLFEAQIINRILIICTLLSINIEPDVPIKSRSNDTTKVHGIQFCRRKKLIRKQFSGTRQFNISHWNVQLMNQF